jgi:hypothetical protein
MPCRANYMEPSRSEEYSKEIAAHLVFVQKQLGNEPDEDHRERLLTSRLKVRVLPHPPYNQLRILI